MAVFITRFKGPRGDEISHFPITTSCEVQRSNRDVLRVDNFFRVHFPARPDISTPSRPHFRVHFPQVQHCCTANTVARREGPQILCSGRSCYHLGKHCSDNIIVLDTCMEISSSFVQHPKGAALSPGTGAHATDVDPDLPRCPRCSGVGCQSGHCPHLIDVNLTIIEITWKFAPSRIIPTEVSARRALHRLHI